MARDYQTGFIKVGFVLVSVALLMSSFAAAEEYEALYEVFYEATASPSSIEIDYLVIDEVSPPISSEDSYYAFPPDLSPEYYKELEECAIKIRRYYVEEILAGIFENKPLTTDSCQALLHLGYDCHVRLLKAVLSRPELKQKASEALPKSIQIWKSCASSIAPSPF